VARQVGEHGFGAGEGTFGVDDPLRSSERRQGAREGSRVGQVREFAEEGELAGTMDLSEPVEEQPAE
jgi:hypothetical protein